MREVLYEVQVARHGGRARILLPLLMLLAIVSFAVGSLFAPYKAIFQCIGLVLLIPLIQITARYFILRHLYRVVLREDGGVDLEVFTYRGGARMQLVCRVGREEIVTIVPLGEKGAVLQGRRYNYHPDMAPREGLLLSVVNGDGGFQILLAYDPRLLTFLAR